MTCGAGRTATPAAPAAARHRLRLAECCCERFASESPCLVIRAMANSFVYGNVAAAFTEHETDETSSLPRQTNNFIVMEGHRTSRPTTETKSCMSPFRYCRRRLQGLSEWALRHRTRASALTRKVAVGRRCTVGRAINNRSPLRFWRRFLISDAAVPFHSVFSVSGWVALSSVGHG